MWKNARNISRTPQVCCMDQHQQFWPTFVFSIYGKQNRSATHWILVATERHFIMMMSVKSQYTTVNYGFWITRAPSWLWIFLCSWFGGKFECDLINCRFSGSETTLQKQNIIHHVLGFVFMYSAQWKYEFPLVYACVMLFMEVTTVFVSGRWLMFQHNISGGNIFQSLNTLCLFFSFMTGRIAF